VKYGKIEIRVVKNSNVFTGIKHPVQNILSASPIIPANAFSLRNDFRNNVFLGFYSL
jgi:hypothetical protein